MFASLRVLGALAIVAIGVGPGNAVAAVSCPDAEVKAAVRSAIDRRMGPRLDVRLDDFACALTSSAPQPLAATLDPLARTGRPVRFVITTVGAGPRGHAVRLGQATATVRLSGEHVRVTRLVSPGGTLVADDLEVTSGPLEGLAFRRLPVLSELLGARLVRGLAAGDAIAADAVAVSPAVRSGDQVRLTARYGSVEATVMAVAEQTAGLGQIIRVVNASSHRPLRARVTAPGEVEVVE